MFDLNTLILAIIAGGAGTIIGGTQTFIITGFVGIIVYILQAAGVNVTFLNDVVLNVFFLPCIIFNGAGFATAYASKKYPIRGTETYKSLAFTNDPLVILCGCFAGLAGYLIYAMANYFGLPMDTGSLSVFLVGILGRILFSNKKYYNQNNLRRLKHPDWYALSYQLLLALMVSTAMAYFAKETGLYTIGFSVSALSLIFSFTDSAFPATHHITLVTGYAVMQTGNITLGILFGVISQIIFFLFAAIFNTDCDTHIDPPAVAIGICSLILFTMF